MILVQYWDGVVLQLFDDGENGCYCIIFVSNVCNDSSFIWYGNIQGDLSNSIFVRKNLLRSTLELVQSKVIVCQPISFYLSPGFSPVQVLYSPWEAMNSSCMDALDYG